jgi:hypothetical protein
MERDGEREIESQRVSMTSASQTNSTGNNLLLLLLLLT